MKVRFSPQAGRDLKAIAAWVSKDRPNAARKLVRELRVASLALANHPHAYAFVEGREAAGIRRVPQGRYVICYSIEADVIAILRILDGARDVPSLL
jgi:toxin ParE1/3/4